MYHHSHSYQEDAFDFFASFLQNIVNGNSLYKDLVKPIITNAHLLAKGDLSYYDISRNGYTVITYLAEKEPEYFKNLDPDTLTNSQYSHILDLVTAQKELDLV